MSAKKNKRKHNQLINFSDKFTLLHIRLTIYIQNLFKQHSFGILFSEKQKIRTDQSTLQIFYSAWKETTHKPSKVATAKRMYVFGTTCLDKCCLFHVIIKSFVFKALPKTLLNRHVFAFFQTSALKEVRVLLFVSRITV